MKESDVSRQTGEQPERGPGRDHGSPQQSASGREQAAEAQCGPADPVLDGLRQLPRLDPPGTFVSSVMEGVRRVRLPWWRRALRWARAPHSVTVVPLRLVPVAAAVLIVAAATLHWLPRDSHRVLIAEPGGNRIPVAFSLQFPEARSVAVIGSFNAWLPNGYEMHPSDRHQSWSIQLKLPPGRYEYAFLVDGQKIIADPEARFYQDDGFGNQNGVLIVGNQHETSI
jgi:hypothetical protein